MIYISFALGHFSFGATVSLILFSYYTKGAESYIKYDIIVASIGGLWAMIPDIPKLFEGLNSLFIGFSCDLFFLHCTLDNLDPEDNYISSVMLFLLFLVVLNLITLQNLKKIKK